MKKLLCPQCKIGRFQVKNDSDESLVVVVNEQHEILPLHKGTSLEGFDLTVLYCLGCSWKGSDKRLTGFRVVIGLICLVVKIIND